MDFASFFGGTGGGFMSNPIASSSATAGLGAFYPTNNIKTNPSGLDLEPVQIALYAGLFLGAVLIYKKVVK